MAGRHPETHGEGRGVGWGGIREKESGRKDRRRECRDSLTLFCQLTPADLSSRLPITYGTFKVTGSRALECMCIRPRHKRGQGSRSLTTEELCSRFHVFWYSAGLVGLVVNTRLNVTRKQSCDFSQESVRSEQSEGKVGGREGGEREGNFVILNLKANSCYYWPVLFFCV